VRVVFLQTVFGGGAFDGQAYILPFREGREKSAGLSANSGSYGQQVIERMSWHGCDINVVET
jgi:hypothetical protein